MYRAQKRGISRGAGWSGGGDRTRLFCIIPGEDLHQAPAVVQTPWGALEIQLLIWTHSNPVKNTWLMQTMWLTQGPELNGRAEIEVWEFDSQACRLPTTQCSQSPSGGIWGGAFIIVTGGWRYNAKHNDYSQSYYTINFKVSERLHLICSYHKKEVIIMWHNRGGS